MIIKLLIELVIGALSIVLSPFALVSNLIYNVFENTGFMNVLKVTTFFFSKTLIIFIITTFIFWTSVFIIRPLVNFIRNRG